MFLEKCNADQRKAIYEEFNITTDSLKKDTKYIMEWMEKQSHLPKITDEEFISNLIINCKNCMEKTKKKLDTYYSVKALLPEIFSERDPTSVSYKKVFNTMCTIPLPKLTPTRHRVSIFRIFSHENINSIGVDDFLSLSSLNYDIATKDDCNSGMINIYDLTNLSMASANLLFQSTRKITTVAPDLYTFRLKKIHVIIRFNNTLTKMLMMLKRTMKKELYEKIQFWTDKNPNLCSMFPAEIIPKDYGGKEKTLAELQALYYEYICGFQDWVKLEHEIKADLSKRRDNLFSTSFNDVDGSFRQLEID